MYRFEQTGKFFAQSKWGDTYEVIEYTKLVNFADAETPNRWEPIGPKRYQLSNGEPLSMLSETEFLTVGRQPVRITKHCEGGLSAATVASEGKDETLSEERAHVIPSIAR